MNELERLQKNVVDTKAAYDVAYAAADAAWDAAYDVAKAAYAAVDAAWGSAAADDAYAAAADDAYAAAWVAADAWKQAKLELNEYLKEQD